VEAAYKISRLKTSERRAIFVGDLIDRGPKQLETVDTVRAMVEAGQISIDQGVVAYAWEGRFANDGEKEKQDDSNTSKNSTITLQRWYVYAKTETTPPRKFGKSQPTIMHFIPG